MELRHLITFRAVAADSSFTRAATQLGYVQSAVTGHVRALETELGVRLFDRLSRGIEMTQAGKTLLDYADRILQLNAEAVSVVGGQHDPTGPVTVSAPEVLCTYRLPEVIRNMHRKHPGVQLLFRASPTGALDPDLCWALTNGDIDAAFVLEENLSSTDTLLVEALCEEPLVLVAAPDHPLAQSREVRPRDLVDAPVMLTDKGCGYRRVFEAALSSAGVRMTIAGEFTSGETVKRCVESGTTVGVLAEISVSTELASGRLIALPWKGPALALTTYLVSAKRRWVSPAKAALRAATHQVFPPPLGDDTVAAAVAGRTRQGS